MLQTIKLNLVPGKVSPVVYASQYDKGREFRCLLFDGEEEYILTTETINICVRKPDGHIVTASVPVVSGNKYVDITTTQQMCAVVGKSICELKISKDDTLIGTLNFCLNVQLDPADGSIQSDSAIHDLNSQITAEVDALFNGYYAGALALKTDSGNILYGKKWAVCGDSFTNGVLDSVIGEGRYYDQHVTYPWLIGNRNNMDIVKFFANGMTLGWPASPGTFVNSLTNPNSERYFQNIPADVDYITIYLGINDEHHSSGDEQIPLGTIDDSTTATYLGAYNVVIDWLITNRPNAHIGIIVSNGIQNNNNYRTGQIAIAQKYGLGYIDLNGDGRTPAMLRTSNSSIPSSVKQKLIDKWAVTSTDTHPNDAAHRYESTFIEEFLRSI